ncbi:twin-arginine translocation pathway signal [Nocardia speluncae]|uniref:Twin-arginine translocation pathway signal n=1 Tax=Nocardia speluncae TaxID=419477 RepID=A0A846XGB4_9NOCA|nr:twin-arginine translocation pathway signal [Nocardia speluncae]NKY33706.1 twin-arginine translocation pathway signal [Nocardia speluncae]
MRIPNVVRTVRRSPEPVLLALLAVVAVALAAALLIFQYRPDSRGDAAKNEVLSAATEGTVALLSYSPESLDRDFASAKSRMTGDFLTYYTQFTEKVIAPAAKEKSVKTSASVVRSAVAEIHPDSAVALLFINQSTTSAEKPDPALAASSVRVTLSKVEDSWLISSFDPV